MSNLLIIGIAVWRASYMLVHETGPARIFERLRAWAKTQDAADGSLGHLLSCVSCTSANLGILAAAAYFVSPTLTIAISMGLAASGIAIWAQELIDRYSVPEPPSDDYLET